MILPTWEMVSIEFIVFFFYYVSFSSVVSFLVLLLLFKFIYLFYVIFFCLIWGYTGPMEGSRLISKGKCSPRIDPLSEYANEP